MRFETVQVRSCDVNGSHVITVPAGFVTYEALDCAETVVIDGVSYLRFGTFGGDGKALIDLQTGVVYANYVDNEMIFVNSSVEKFTECVKGILSVYPLYDEGSEPEDWERAAKKVQELVARADSACYAHGTFWYEFRWDVTLGDYWD
jgi:hypothetical protein